MGKLDALLIRSGFTIVGGTSLFRLAHSDLAPARFKQLLNAGILARAFNLDTRLLRFSLPHGGTTWRRLLQRWTESTAKGAEFVIPSSL